MTFNEILNQDRLITYFKTLIKTKKIAKTYIIEGKKGLGKKSIIDAFLLEFFCERDIKPCGECHSCKMLLKNTDLDIINIDLDGFKSIGISAIKTKLNETILLKPKNHTHKVYIISNADKLTIEAQNSILKTIEEAPSYAIIFLLVQNKDLLLDTIKSRAIKLNMNFLSEIKVREYLSSKNLEIEEDLLEYARGNVGLVLDFIKDKDKKEEFNKNIKFLINIKHLKMIEVLDFIKEFKEDNDSLYEFINLIRMWYRDLLLLKMKDDKKVLIFKSKYRILKELRKQYSYFFINKILKFCLEAEQRINSNTNVKMNIRYLLDGIRGE